jgi:Xaa-Pro aminopeptidase
MQRQSKFGVKSIPDFMASLREIKGKRSFTNEGHSYFSYGTREIMKAMHVGMSESEIQGIHEFISKKYGSEFEVIHQ